ncbi:hypothetical protein AVEN_191575-1 [Araneus ventricosus]|uniref:DUF4817 domain-containing protein n=1 Tax=Araneus ventricosus TaxID=182803 RepID=A0A4Y2WCS5_ARAVE|nr:hypothetical protein AVEN_191575-1 [Araneus ventricosus]
MATTQQKSFCVLRFAKCESLITVQRDFRRQHPGVELPITQIIRRWYKQFQDMDLFCGKGNPLAVPACQTRMWRASNRVTHLPGEGTTSDIQFGMELGILVAYL